MRSSFNFSTWKVKHWNLESWKISQVSGKFTISLDAKLNLCPAVWSPGHKLSRLPFSRSHGPCCFFFFVSRRRNWESIIMISSLLWLANGRCRSTSAGLWGRKRGCFLLRPQASSLLDFSERTLVLMRKDVNCFSSRLPPPYFGSFGNKLLLGPLACLGHAALTMAAKWSKKDLKACHQSQVVDFHCR